MWFGLVGSTATLGSTSEFSNSVPDCATPSQPGANGLGPEAVETGVGTNAPERAAPATTAAESTSSASTVLFISSSFSLRLRTGCCLRGLARGHDAGTVRASGTGRNQNRTAVDDVDHSRRPCGFDQERE